MDNTIGYLSVFLSEPGMPEHGLRYCHAFHHFQNPSHRAAFSGLFTGKGEKEGTDDCFGVIFFYPLFGRAEQCS